MHEYHPCRLNGTTYLMHQGQFSHLTDKSRSIVLEQVIINNKDSIAQKIIQKLKALNVDFILS